MSRWYRAYTGTVTDDKLAEAALVAGCSRSVAIAGWHCILESAANRNNCGSFDATPRRIAAVLCEPLATVEALVAAFEELSLIVNGAVSAWKRRQYLSDTSNDRVKRHREQRKAQGLPAQWQPPKGLRQEIYGRDGNACVYCGASDDLTLDHKVPEMHGGDHSADNLQTACRSCNARKRDLTHDEYTERLAGNGHVTLQQRPHRTEAKTEKKETPNGVYAVSDETPCEQPLGVREVVEAWNLTADKLGLAQVRTLSAERRQKVKARIREHTLEDFQAALAAIERSPFLRGDSKGGWRADFDFFVQKSSFIKLVEGSYERA